MPCIVVLTAVTENGVRNKHVVPVRPEAMLMFRMGEISGGVRVQLGEVARRA